MNLAVRAYLERVVFTFLQAFLAFVLAVPGARVSWTDALSVGLFAAVVAVLTSVATLKLKALTDPLLDLAYRTLMTFVQTLAGLAFAAGAVGLFDFGWTGAVKVSLIAAGTALLKALIGIRAGETPGASVLTVTPERGLRQPNPEPVE